MDPEWSIQREGSNYVLGGSEHKWASLSDHEWSDYRVTFQLRLWQGTIHLNYRIMPNPNGTTRYYIGFQEGGLYLMKSNPDGSWSELAGTQFRHSLGDWHNIEIAGWGGHLRVYVDGTLEIEVVDENYLRNGSIAFETLDNSSAQIDNIEVMGSGPEPAIDSNHAHVDILPPASIPVTCTSYYMTEEYDTDRYGMDYWSEPIAQKGVVLIDTPLNYCKNYCLNDTYCQAYTFKEADTTCWLKSGMPEQQYLPGFISGIKACQ